MLLSLHHVTLVHSCHTSSFISFTSKHSFTTKEEFIEGEIQYMYKKRELSSHKGELSPEIQMYNIYNVWQPSLVLGGLGRALTVPIACKGSILGLALQAY